MTDKRFIQDEAFILQKENRLYETWVVAHNEHYAEIITEAMNLLYQENEQLKKALWCIRKRYGYSIEEFVEDLKDNGIDLTKVDLE